MVFLMITNCMNGILQTIGGGVKLFGETEVMFGIK